MTDRTLLANAFLKTTDFRDAQQRPLAGDASNRRYLRLTRADGAKSVLMDAAPDRGEDTRPFIAIADHLAKIGLSAPRILAADTDNGFLLLEDLGDALYARVIPATPEPDRDAMEMRLYRAAIDALLVLHAHPAPDVASYDAALMTDMAAQALLYYRDFGGAGDPAIHATLRDLIEPQLAAIAPEQPVLILRDYHAENLIWLPERDGAARVGQLDFQDALLGHPAYDLVSLLQDARRDVPVAVETAMIERFCAGSGHDLTRFRHAYHLLSIQRNLRIIGVFARLSLRNGKPHYIDMIPRVWGLLQRDLAQPQFGDLAQFVTRHLPAPDEIHLNELRDRCATLPMH